MIHYKCFVTFLAVVVLSAVPAASKDQKHVVEVSNTDDLYAAVNDSRNVNTEIRLLPNTYTLSSMDSAGRLRPNGGRLELKEGMELQGSNEYLDDMEPRGVTPSGELIFADVATESVIDASQLPFEAFAIPPARTGVLRIGRDNEVSNLTIRNSCASSMEWPCRRTNAKIGYQ